MRNNSAKKSKHPFLGLLRELLLPEIVSLVVAWILARLTDNIFLRGVTIFLQFVIVVSTPILIWDFLGRLKARIHFIAKILVCTLLTLAISALFSTSTYTQPLEIAEQGEVLDGTFYVGKYLRGSKDCRKGEGKCLNRVVIEGAQLYRMGNDLSVNTLHIILDINWSKWEKFPTLPRNYAGRVYYKIPFECSSRAPIIGDYGKPTYTIAPKSILLTYLIGFTEIPFMLSSDRTMPRNIIKIAKTEGIFCS